MDTIVKVLNEKVEDGNAKTIVEALKQIDTSAEGDTVAEVLKNMNLGGGGGGALSNPHVTITFVKNYDDEGDPLVIFGVCVVENDILKGDVELNNDSVIIDSIAQYYESDASYAVICGIYDFSVSASNAINCTWNHGSIIVSDATNNASITLTVSLPPDDN